jgi:hypothetical protein
MELNIKYVFIVIIILFIVYNTQGQKENFCQNCDDTSLEDCGKCPDCGICVTDFEKKCVRGDKNGPYFYDSCNEWIYNDKEPTNECWKYNKKYSQHNCGGYMSYQTRLKLRKMYGRLYGNNM